MRIVTYDHICSHNMEKRTEEVLISYANSCKQAADRSDSITLASHVDYPMSCFGVSQEETRERQVKEPKASSACYSNTVVEHRGDSQASWETPTLSFKGTSECLMEVVKDL